MTRRLAGVLLCTLLARPAQASAPRPPEPPGVQLLKAQQMIRELASKDPDRRALAAQGLASYGTADRGALAALQRVITSDPSANVRLQAVISLGALAARGEAGAARHVQQALKDRSPDVRLEAELATGRHGPRLVLDQGAAARTLRLAGVADPRIFQLMAPGLHHYEVDGARLQRAAAQLRPRLVTLLTEKDAAVRFGAAALLAAMREAAAGAGPALVKALADAHPQVRTAAAWALGAVGPLPGASVAALGRALRDPYWGVRRAAALAIAQGKVGGQQAGLIAIVADSIDEVGNMAATALGRIAAGLDDRATVLVVDALTRALRSGGWQTRRGALDALGQLGPRGARAAVEAGRALHDPIADVRPLAAWALGRMGAAARPAVAELIRALRQEALQQSVVDALGDIGPGAAVAVSPLTKVLEHKDSRRRGYAAVALGKIGPAARTAVPALIRLLKDPAVERSWVRTALRAIGTPQAIEAAKE